VRIACIHVPSLALQAVLRRTPEQREEAVALAESGSERARILACTRAARAVGVRPGLLVSQARAVSSALCAGKPLRVVSLSPADSAATSAALADVGYAFAPQVQCEAERLFLEVSELGRMYPAGEQAVAQALVAQAWRVGIAVRVGIASSKGVARVAAQAADIAICPSGQERAFLAPLPVQTAFAAGAPAAVADAEDTMLETLGRWGTHTLGAIAALPAAEVVLRLGRNGAWLHRIASGVSDEPFAPQLPPDALEEGTDLDYPIYEIEPLAFVLRGLLDRALGRLAGRGLACAALGLRLKLDPRGHDVRDVPLAAPTREVSTLLQLVRLDLARHPPSAPVVGMTLLVLPARVRASQLDLWRPAGPTPEALAATMARLAALVGPENVGTPTAVDSFKEEQVAITPFQPAPSRSAASQVAPPSQPATSELTLGLRRFRPPQALEVLMDRDGPSALRGRQITARVLVAAGPYRSSGDWWTADAFSRDYWDVQASDGAVYRLHQDRESGTWFLDGYYD
jgi:protein ImuB